MGILKINTPKFPVGRTLNIAKRFINDILWWMSTGHKLLLSVSTHHRNFILTHESDEGKARTEDKLVSYRIYI